MRREDKEKSTLDKVNIYQSFINKIKTDSKVCAYIKVLVWTGPRKKLNARFMGTHSDARYFLNFLRWILMSNGRFFE